MGVVYKLKPEIREFILSKKKENPYLSCRNFVNLIQQEYSLRVSKSQINNIIKQAGLSNPVGRRLQGKKRVEKKGLGEMILTAVDSMIKQDFRQILFLKIVFADGRAFYIDAQLRTVWSVPYIPYDFSSPIYKIKDYIKRYFSQNTPLILFTSPGYDKPPSEFCEFLKYLHTQDLVSITLCSYKDEQIEYIPISKMSNLEGDNPVNNKHNIQRREVIFGLWPWQFESHREIKINSEFKFYYFAPLKQSFYIAEAEIALSAPKSDWTINLQSCVIRREGYVKPSIFICSTLAPNILKPEELASIYLNQWPNLEEGFEDYSHKIELFTYTATSREVSSAKCPVLAKQDYKKALDLYVRTHFLPPPYQEMDFSLTRERFYNLKARLIKKKDYYLLSFLHLPNYSYLKDLLYLCRRLNERNLTFNQRPLWFEVATQQRSA
jgi:hypothetical protein